MKKVITEDTEEYRRHRVSVLSENFSALCDQKSIRK